jgi:hypothetical protein
LRHLHWHLHLQLQTSIFDAEVLRQRDIHHRFQNARMGIFQQVLKLPSEVMPKPSVEQQVRATCSGDS